MKMPKQVRVTVYASLDLVGCKDSREFLYSEDEWNALSQRDKEEACREELFEMVEWSYDVEPAQCP